MSRFIRIQMTGANLAALLRTGYAPRIVKGLPADAKLYGMNYTKQKDLIDVWFTSETEGHELPSAFGMNTLPVDHIDIED